MRTIISSPEMEVRQGTNGSLLAAEDYLDDTLQNQPAAIALRTAQAIWNELHGDLMRAGHPDELIPWEPNGPRR